jgi:cyclic beta-1,2-glucan synthetase
MDRFAALCERRDDPDRASHWRHRATALRAKTEAAAWDGAWYVRAFHDDGSLVGSSKERECQIDSIAQSWAVLSRPERRSARNGSAEETRPRVALRSADDRLVREADGLALLLTPPFDTTVHDPGYIRAYPPGVRENGGQYTHAATWLGLAYVGLGDGERAARIFRILTPILHARTREQLERYRVEPYVLAGDVYGAVPWVGRGGWTWYTGSAAWLYRLGIEGILGLRKENGDLCIDPCMPPSWDGFEAWVRAGEQQIHVVVENPESVAQGVVAVTLDGARVGSNRIPLDANPGSRAGKREVTVRMGRTDG